MGFWRRAEQDPSWIAVIDPDGTEVSAGDLLGRVNQITSGLQAAGLRPGDGVAALLPNVPEAVIGLLASASLGAIWSSCSPDFGASSVIDRFAQIEPTVLIGCDGYAYGGKEFSRADMLADVVAALPGVAADPGELRAEVATVLDTVLAAATLDRPQAAPMAQVAGQRGRDGVHTEAFGYILAELQSLARAHPDATW